MKDTTSKPSRQLQLNNLSLFPHFIAINFQAQLDEFKAFSNQPVVEKDFKKCASHFVLLLITVLI
jgi:hypothetical protein